MPNVSPPSPTPDQKPPGASRQTSGLPEPADLKLVENPISPPGKQAVASHREELQTNALPHSAVGEVFQARHPLPFTSSAACGTNNPAAMLQMPKAFASACSKVNVKPTNEQMQNAQKHIQQLLSKQTPPTA